MHVDAGKLSKRIQFLRKTTAKDADGYDVPGEPELVRETWAQYSQTSGTELVRAGAEFGEAKEVIQVEEYAGPALQIGFNGQYVIQFLDVVETDKVALELKDEVSQAVMKPIGEEAFDYTYVLMPMRF